MSTPVTTQPPSNHGGRCTKRLAEVQWMPRPLAANCPPGLEYLTTIDRVLVKQQVLLLQLSTGMECKKYGILNSIGQHIYFAYEENELYMRKQTRGYIIHIIDNMGEEVMRVVREFKCCAGCCWCANGGHCSLEVTVEASVGQIVGKVKQTCSFIRSELEILTPDNDLVMKVRGPVCVYDGACCKADQEFNVFSPDDKELVGKISKQYAGFAKELFTRADDFEISFPMYLDVKIKATIIGALFLIDFMFFENKG